MKQWLFLWISTYNFWTVLIRHSKYSKFLQISKCKISIIILSDRPSISPEWCHYSLPELSSKRSLKQPNINLTWKVQAQPLGYILVWPVDAILPNKSLLIKLHFVTSLTVQTLQTQWREPAGVASQQCSALWTIFSSVKSPP